MRSDSLIAEWIGEARGRLGPDHEWRPWMRDYRLPAELGWRYFLKEHYRRVLTLFFGPILIIILPLIVTLAGIALVVAIVALIILIVILVILALLSLLAEDPDNRQPEPAPAIISIASATPDPDLARVAPINRLERS